MIKTETVTVEIPQAMADHIRKQRWFIAYRDLEQFVFSGARELMLHWDRKK